MSIFERDFLINRDPSNHDSGKDWLESLSERNGDTGQETEGTGKRECTPEEPGGKPVLGQCDPQGGALKKVISPDRRRQAVEQVQTVMDVSERRVCRMLGQPRSTQRYKKRIPENEEILTGRMVALASEYGRYGYRRITAMLRGEGWQVNHKSVERLWRREGLKVPAKQPKHGRLWLNDGSIVRLRAEFPKHV